MSTAALPVGRGRALRDLEHPPTRGAGIAFIVAAVAAAVLPWPLGLWIVAMVAVICVVAMVTAYADRARQVNEAAQRAKTAEMLTWLGEVGAASEEVESEWAELYASAHRPLTFGPERKRLRNVTVRVPSQRRAGAGS